LRLQSRPSGRRARGFGSFTCPSVPTAAGPLYLATKVHSPLKIFPYRVSSRSLDLPSCRSAFNFLRFLVPPTISPGIAPCDVGCPTPTSVPLSGFLNLSAVSWQAQASWPCFVPQPVPGILPFERFPHEDRAPLSRPLAPLQLSTGVPERAERRRSPPVLPTSTPSRGCLDPPQTMDSLSARQGALPGRPELHSTEPFTFRQLHLLRSFPPLARPYLQPWVAPQPQAVALGFCPFEAFSSHASDPRPARPRRTEHAPSPEGSGTRLVGPVTPRVG
jgi:hypothetical protein